MYYLGIDPGIRKLGYALIDFNLKIIDAGILLSEISSPDRQDNFHRMIEIADFFEELIDKYPIKSVGIEKLYFTKFNQSNAEFVYGVRGILISQFIKKGMKIYEYTPLQLKKYITGNGNASKILVQNMVAKIYRLTDMPKYHDTADALGLAFLVKNKG